MNETATFSLISAVVGWILGNLMARPWTGFLRRKAHGGEEGLQAERALKAAIAELKKPKPRFGERGDIDRGYPVEA